MGGFFGCCGHSSGGSSSSGATLGARLAFASPSGSVVASPTGFSSSTGRLIVTLPSGNATWTGLNGAGQVDGQLLEIVNNDGANTLTLPQANWGGVGDLNLGPGNKTLSYYDSALGKWQVTSP